MMRIVMKSLKYSSRYAFIGIRNCANQSNHNQHGHKPPDLGNIPQAMKKTAESTIAFTQERLVE